MKERKIYDFPFEKVKDRVISGFGSLKNQGTIADLLAKTALPKHQLETVLPSVVSECRGQMKVGESGDILYYFPKGMSNIEKGFLPSAARFFKGLWKGISLVLTFLFKVWITIMVVGYFVLFVTIMVMAVLAGIAASAAGNKGSSSSSRKSNFGMFHIAGRLISWTIRLWLYSGLLKDDTRREKKKPLHQSFYEFVFGVDHQDAHWDDVEKRTVLSFISHNKGIISLEEFMSITGRDREAANAYISRLMLEMEGEPQVSDRGTLYYFFPELLKTSLPPLNVRYLEERPEIPFTNNLPSTNRWIVFFNGFNMLLGGYFLYFSLFPNSFNDFSILAQFVYEFSNELFNSTSWIYLGLGLIPLAYSVVFFAVPALRRIGEKKKNLKLRNQKAYRSFAEGLMKPPFEIAASSSLRDKKLGTASDDRWVKSRILDFAGDKHVEVEEKQGSPVYQIPEVAEEISDLEKLRKTVDPNKYKLGSIVYDTGKDS